MDKYSKQMENKLYRQVSVSDRLPQTEGRYLVKSHGEWFSASYLEQFSFNEEMLDCSGVTHWLEEISLPTNEEIRKERDAYSYSKISGLFRDGWRFGIKYILENLEGKKYE